MAVYKKEFPTLGGYLTDGSKPNLKRVENFIQAVGSYEDQIFQKRARLHQRQADRIKREKGQLKRGDDAQPQVEPESLVPVSRFHGSRLASAVRPSPFQKGAAGGTDNGAHSSSKAVSSARSPKVARMSSTATIGAAIVAAENSLEMDVNENKEELKAKLKESLREKSDSFNSEDREEDKIKLGEPGWKERYYEEKFSAKSLEEMESIRKDVVLKYTEGLCWVMHYYYEGVCSWQWFYPYHYAPFASDIKDIAQLDIKFELGSPFKPFDQLMGVFPAASAHALPEQYRKLMMDPNSPILDFYPTDFEVDMNGKRFAWQGIAKLPFIEEGRLLDEISKVEHTLTADEKRRNSFMSDMLFVAVSHSLSPYIFSLDDRCKTMNEGERSLIKEKLDPKASGGMNGYICLSAGDPCPPIFRSPISGLEDIVDNQVICAIYQLPDYHKHISRPPPGVKFPKKIVSMGDLNEAVLWHEDNGRRHMDNGRRHMDNGRRDVDYGNRNIINGRPNPPGSLSGRQLGDAAHRLVINSLQNAPHGELSAFAPHPDGRSNGHDYSRMVPPPKGGYPVGEPIQQPPPAVQNRHNSGDRYGTHHSQNRRNNNNNNNLTRSSVGPRPGYYAQGGPHHHQPLYPLHQPVPLASASGVPVVFYQIGHVGDQRYQNYGVGGYSQWGGGPQFNNYASQRGGGAGGGRFSGSDRGSNRRPPPPNSHGRR